MSIYIFFYEGKEQDPELEIEKEIGKDVYETAYEAFGPQVDDLMYKKKLTITDELGNVWCNCEKPNLVPNRLKDEKGQAYCLDCHSNWYH